MNNNLLSKIKGFPQPHLFTFRQKPAVTLFRFLDSIKTTVFCCSQFLKFVQDKQKENEHYTDTQLIYWLPFYTSFGALQQLFVPDWLFLHLFCPTSTSNEQSWTKENYFSKITNLSSFSMSPYSTVPDEKHRLANHKTEKFKSFT